jgi:hypothetical protein
LTVGVAGFSLTGEDTGDELLARFLFLRWIIGEWAAVLIVFCLLSHIILSLGDT